MSKPLIIEEESGTIVRTRHPHNGYYAGDPAPVREGGGTRSPRPAGWLAR